MTKGTKYFYGATLLRVVDGDTIDALIDLGFKTFVKNRIRYMGIDTWESRTRDLEEKKKGKAAKARNKELLEQNDGKFLVQSHGLGKYGRLLGEIFIESYDGAVNKEEPFSVNEILKSEGHAYEYSGGKKRVFGSKK
jgi:micrococcal nuclease